MTVLAFCLFAALVLTVAIGWQYIDSVREERHSDAYEQGWANGYNVGTKNFGESVDSSYKRGFEAGRAAPSAAQKRSKKPVKKISTKGE